MVGKSAITLGRGRGRPRTFDPDAAIDAAMSHFWERGYEGTDVAGIAHAVGVTKPSLYQLFGDKRQIFALALQRYNETLGAAPLRAFQATSPIEAAVQLFLRVAVEAQTEPGRPAGCLLACVASSCDHDDGETRAIYAQALKAGEAMLTERFEAEVTARALRAGFPAQARAALLLDLMQASALRARAGASREELLRKVQAQAALVLSDSPERKPTSKAARRGASSSGT